MDSLVSDLRAIVREEANKLIDERLALLNAKNNSEFIPLLVFCRENHISPPTVYRAIKRHDLSLIKFNNKAYLKRSEANGLFVRVK